MNFAWIIMIVVMVLSLLVQQTLTSRFKKYSKVGIGLSGAEVSARMMADNGPQLNQWVLDQLKPMIVQVRGGFAERMERYFLENGYAAQEKRLLKAAHYLATQWEFNILYQLCPFIRGIEQIKQEIEDQLEDHINLIGVQKISLKRKTYGFIDLCGQLQSISLSVGREKPEFAGYRIPVQQVLPAKPHECRSVRAVRIST